MYYSEFALCKASQEGTKKTFLGAWLDGKQRRVFFAFDPKGEQNPLYYCNLCICTSEKEAINLILNTRKARHLFYCC